MLGDGRGAYAGQPISFACSKCRRSRHYRSPSGRFTTGIGTNYRTTGKLRRQRSEGSNMRDWPDHAYQYECFDCGHVGWSRHPQVQERYRVEHASDIVWQRVGELVVLRFNEGDGALSDADMDTIVDAVRRDPEKYSRILVAGRRKALRQQGQRKS